MPNYQDGKIYMIESISNNCRYYGSTVTTLSRRLAEHRSSIKRGVNIASKKVLKYSDARILLVVSFPCNSKMELEAKEAEYIRDNDCVNKKILQRTNKQYMKQYRENNKEVIAEKNLKKCLCDCGKEYTHINYNRHLRTKQHTNWQKIYDFIIS